VGARQHRAQLFFPLDQFQIKLFIIIRVLARAILLSDIVSSIRLQGGQS
jgi:hypothetical protein